MELPQTIGSVGELDSLLSTPPDEVVDEFARLDGDVIFLGVGGKIGPSLALMARRACEQAGISKRIIGVSRFTTTSIKGYLAEHGIETITGDLLDYEFLAQLPDIQNVFYLAALKFGASANAPLTWAMNVKLPAQVADRYRDSRIVTYSSGNVYPYVSNDSGGCTEADDPGPVGEYAQSVLGRERMFEYGSQEFGTPVTIVRLNYAVELRYGVLLDIGMKVKKRLPIDLSNGHVNVIWQGDSNAATLRSINLCSSPARLLNVTGPEILSVRETANSFGQQFGVDPVFENTESEKSLLADASQACRLFGRPRVSVDQLIRWITDWLTRDELTFDKPTAFEVTDGRY